MVGVITNALQGVKRPGDELVNWSCSDMFGLVTVYSLVVLCEGPLCPGILLNLLWPGSKSRRAHQEPPVDGVRQGLWRWKSVCFAPVDVCFNMTHDYIGYL